MRYFAAIFFACLAVALFVGCTLATSQVPVPFHYSDSVGGGLPSKAGTPYNPLPPVYVVLHDSYFTPVALGWRPPGCFTLYKAYTHLEPRQTIPAKGDPPIWVNTNCGEVAVVFTQGDPPAAQCFLLITGSYARIFVHPGNITDCHAKTERDNRGRMFVHVNFNLQKQYRRHPGIRLRRPLGR